MPLIPSRRSPTRASLVIPFALCALLLGGCGGGGSDAAAPLATAAAAATSAVDAALPSQDTTRRHVSSATSAGRNAVGLLDDSLRSARVLLALKDAAGGAAAIPCPAGGSASITLPASLAGAAASASWAAGSDYTFDLSACQLAAGAAPMSGSLALHVFAATASDASVSLTLRELSVGGQGGTLTLNGSASVQITQVDASDGSSTQTLRISSPTLGLVALAADGGRSEFVLTGAAFTDDSRSVNGVLASTRMKAAYQLSAQLPFGSFGYSVATLGDVVSSAAGVPQSGGWRFSFGGISIDVTVSAATVQIAVDLDTNGHPELSFALPTAALFGSTS